jgi:hypothetical protein
LSFHFSDRNFRFTLLISFKIQLQQNTNSSKVRLWRCDYGHVQEGWAVTFHFNVIRLWVSDLVLLTETELLQKCTNWWKKTWGHFFYLHSLSILANLIYKWLFLAVGLQQQKIRMCIMVTLTCFKFTDVASFTKFPSIILVTTSV